LTVGGGATSSTFLLSKRFYRHYTSVTHEIYHKLLITDVVNMPRNNVQADSLFIKAIEYQLKNPNLTVCDAMKLAESSLRE
jgi:hypothetical protein